MITQCCIHELYLAGKSQQPGVDLAKSFERRMCNHREPIPGDDCLMSVVGDTNKHRYVIATQSQPLRIKLRSIPAVPIVHVNRSVMVLEPPSDATMKTKEAAEEQALHPSAPDLALISSTSTVEPLRKKKKGPKGPNPMSMKKKKKKDIDVVKPKAQGKDEISKPHANGNEKRKRDSSEDEGDEGERGQDLADRVSSAQKRRKRRRKSIAMTTR